MKRFPLFQDTTEIRARLPHLVAAPWRSRAVAALTVAALIGLAVFAALQLEFTLARLGTGLMQVGKFLSLMVPPSPGSQLPALVNALAETVAIAFLGTLVAAIVSLPLGFVAAHNTTFSGIARFFARRASDTIRGIDTLIWALIWINVVGLGPFAGVLAIMTSDIGSFTKLYSEAIEAVDKRAAEGVASAGGSRLHVVRFGILPQVLPVLISQTLYYFESNTRSATIIGIVGAGGIGLYLAENIRMYDWDKVAFIILMILVTVATIDFVSSLLRGTLVGSRTVAL